MHDNFQPVVYLIANRKNGTLYTGVTSHLINRLVEHRDGVRAGFSKEHGTKILVWFELHDTMATAILREKQIKKWNRQWKINLIEVTNPNWCDLAMDLGFERLPSQAAKTPRSGDGPPHSRG